MRTRSSLLVGYVAKKINHFPFMSFSSSPNWMKINVIVITDEEATVVIPLMHTANRISRL